MIVPVYNVERWLKRCVRSICAQTYDALEIILVDDGSTDSSGQMCDEFAAEDARIRVIHKENGGLSDARNAGITCASGEYIGFVDSDDWIEPGFAAHLMGVMLKEHCDAAGCAFRKCAEDEQLQPASEGYSSSCYNRLSAMSDLIDNRIQQVVWNKLYKRTLIARIPFEKGKYHEDEYWSYQVFARLDCYVQTDYVGYNYFQRAGSIMSEAYSLKRLDAVRAKVNRQAYLDANMPELADKGRVNLLFTCMYHGQLALKHLEKEECGQVFAFLKNVIRNNQVLPDELEGAPLKQKIWCLMAQRAFVLICCIRNALKIGV